MLDTLTYAASGLTLTVLVILFVLNVLITGARLFKNNKFAAHLVDRWRPFAMLFRIGDPGGKGLSHPRA